MFGLAVTTALASVMLSGCASGKAPMAAHSAGQAEVAMAKGKPDKAVSSAEAAVLADPRNPAYRAVLGSAYLDAGRFASAATSFDDALTLGDTSPRTALSLALALAGAGKQAEAAQVLNDYRSDIAKPDLGLAFSLAGYPERGIAVLSDAIRSGENTAKTRQNLAYSYALAGRWKEARLMAAEDVPADMISDRIAEWAQTAQPGYYQVRVAGLLGVPVGAKDVGQPLALALNNNPSVDQLAAQSADFETGELAPVGQPVQTTLAVAPAQPAPRAMELPPIGDAAPVAGAQVASVSAPAPRQTFDAAFAASAPVAAPMLAAVSSDTQGFVRSVQAQPARAVRQPVSTGGQLLRTPKADDTHLVQLGSFASEAGAKRAWNIYTKRYPELAAHDMVVTQAVVKGKRYWRVSAAGFDRGTSRSMCGKVQNSGAGCFAWAEGAPMKGAIDTSVRLARR
jgi:Flp pilus assembly protein TadD